MQNKRINEIDLIRFLAALSTVFFHYTFRGHAADSFSVMPYPWLSPIFKYGYLGVELFFMVSGFVILMTTVGGSLKQFTASRIARLYPAFWVCCTLTVVAALVFGDARYPVSLGQYLANLTMLNMFFGISHLDGSYWTLTIELRFYALVALILILRKIQHAQLFLTLWLAASIILEILPIGMLRLWLIVDYSAYFIAGATFFLIWSQGFSRARAALIVASWGLALFHSTHRLGEFEAHYHTSMNRYVVAGIVTFFYLLMFCVSTKCMGILGKTQWFLAGAVTYPFYLLHHNLGFMIFNLAYPAVNPHLLLWGTIIFCLMLAYAVHVLIEKRYALRLKNSLTGRLTRLPQPI
jgi:peptidoglycan/LPS O-acetylase OafA/YrhL